MVEYPHGDPTLAANAHTAQSQRQDDMEADNKDRRQGSVISPLFANVYLHYVFDLWAERWRRREATGTMVMTRYADGCPVLFGGFVATMTEF